MNEFKLELDKSLIEPFLTDFKNDAKTKNARNIMKLMIYILIKIPGIEKQKVRPKFYSKEKRTRVIINKIRFFY